MRYLLFLLLISTTVWSAKILSYNVYDRTDRVDIMITFDTPYEGVIRQSQQNSSYIIKLEEASIEEAKSKAIESKYLNQVDILPQEGAVEIVARANNNISMIASKTADSYGLRLRFTTKAASSLPTKGSISENRLPTKNSNEIGYSYYVVIAIMLIGVGVLFYLKQSIAKKLPQNTQKAQKPWLFDDKSAIEEPKERVVSTIIESDGNVSVRFQKNLDEQNSVVMIEYGNMSYLMVLGQNPILLDKFKDNKIVSENEFNNLLYAKQNELDNYFRIESSRADSFDAYKEKASREY